MPTIFLGNIRVDYSQAYVMPDQDDYPSMVKAFAGQRNGICGAGDPGKLFLDTGRHQGPVNMEIVLFEREPSIEATWEEIVEVSFYPWKSALNVCGWSGIDNFSFRLPSLPYRLRVCASGMDAAREARGDEVYDKAIDRYLLQFWRANFEVDQVIRSTSSLAKARHQQVTQQSGA